MILTAPDYSPRFNACEARLRIAGATCASISDGGSRYFNYGRDLKIRVADHPSGEAGFWHQEIRVDQSDWQQQLNALLGPVRMGVVDMPSAVYFGDHSAVSQSMLKVFAGRRRLYEAYYVTGSLPEPADNDPMRKGTATHTALLEPHRFERIVVTFPPDMLASNGAVSTKEAKAFRAEHEAAGHVVLKEADAAKVRAMADSVRSVCGDWLSLPGDKEKALYWQDEGTDLLLKMRLDWLVSSKSLVVFDLKTTADASPREFRKRCEQNLYALQAVHYIDGVEQAYGKTPAFYFIAVESEPPFACAIHELDEESLGAARAFRNRLLFDLEKCIAERNYADPWERRITTLSLNPYRYAQE